MGTFTAGTELHFQVVADPTGIDWPQGALGVFDPLSVFNWDTGPGSRNSDGAAHAFVDSPDFLLPLVGFEDLPNLGDAAYEDIQYNFSNVRAVAAPDTASALGLLSIGLTGLAAL